MIEQDIVTLVAKMQRQGFRSFKLFKIGIENQLSRNIKKHKE